MIFTDQHVMILGPDDSELGMGEWSDELDELARVHSGYAVVINSEPPVIYADYRPQKVRVTAYLAEQSTAIRESLAGPETCELCGGKVRDGACRDCGNPAPAQPAPGEVDHAQCDPAAHDRSLPDDGGRPYSEPYDEHGYLSDKQAMAADGLLGCNDCGRPLFYCTSAEWYFHVDPEAGCFLAPAWGQS